ncbi:MAG TPA: pyridoxal-phosphate dependent enzyme [Gaiellaceae bacterium]
MSFRVACLGCRRPLGGAFLPFCPACGEPAEVEYDLENVRLRESDNPYERYADLLPVGDRALLPEGAAATPTVHAERLGDALGLERLYLKDETVLPTGTTKDRMAAVALAYLYERGVRAFATSSTGNSSTAYAHAISRFPGLVMHLFTAAAFASRVDVPDTDQVVETVLDGATFVEAFEAAAEFARHDGVVSEGGFFNPGRREGLKLAFLEAAEQAPEPIDWYVQAVSSAMGVYGVFKAAKELRRLGLTDRLPRLLCVQQETCAPMVSAWEAGSSRIRPEDVVARPAGIATSILRGDPSRAYPYVHAIVAESGGTFVAVSEAEIREARELVEELESIRPCFSAAAAVAGAAKLRRLRRLPADATVLVNVTGRERAEPAAARAAERRRAAVS